MEKTVNDMDRTIRIAGFCSGVGMLEQAVRLGCEYFGWATRTAVLCEWEAYAAACLLARMEDESMEPAPIFCGDLRDFDGRPFRGCLDIITAGLPCQPYSLAGKQEGLADQRSYGDGDGPIPNFLRIVAECRPAVVFCENVPPWVRGGWFRPVGEELCRLGYTVEQPLFVTAESVGASHRRERVFVLAHADSNTNDDIAGGFRERFCDPARNDCQLAQPAQRGFGVVREPPRSDGQPDGSDTPVDNAAGTRPAHAGERGIQGEANGQGRLSRSGERCNDPLGESSGRRRRIDQPGRGSDRRAVAWRTGEGIFAPGPGADWRGIPQWLWPSLSREEAQSVFCRVADGMAYRLDGGVINEHDMRELPLLFQFCPIKQRPLLLATLLARVGGNAAAKIKRCFAQAIPASSIAQWKAMQQMRLDVLLGPTSSRLQQTTGCDAALSEMSSEAGFGRGEAGDSEAGDLSDLQITVSAKEDSPQQDLRESGVPEVDGHTQCDEAMGLNLKHRADQLRCGGNGVVPLQAAVAFVELMRSVISRGEQAA